VFLFRADPEVLFRALLLLRLVLLLLRLLDRAAELFRDFVVLVVAMNPSMDWGTRSRYPNLPLYSPGP
jgi:hypothetical protein